MPDATNFPDLAHFEQIRGQLWRGRGIGQAAVMVGAGFSRNAVPLLPDTRPFPLWQDLALPLYRALHPEVRDDVEAAENATRASANGGILRLAYEFETAFGRTQLDALIEGAVPEDAYAPGEAHELLLGLPWTDVFTTNYDTLLERTRAQIHDRKYDVVVSPNELPGRHQPRIVKLHGSLGARRHFIITEEDYRTYPARLAPFVNTVQQSLMENSLVLLGFSGDDPNFLRWIGWVRDNLGSACPTIYLCGLLDLTGSKRRLLETLNVAPIDFTPLFPAAAFVDLQARHSAAVRWLLYGLVAGQPTDLIAWPQPGARRTLPPDLDPPVPPGPEALAAEPIFPGSVDLGDLETMWRRTRERYPGWAVLPRENRDALWNATERWVDAVLQGAQALPTASGVLLLHELVWRLDRCLVPLVTEWAETIQRVVRRCNPFPNVPHGISSASEERPMGDGRLAGLDEAWMSLVFALLRRAREDEEPTFQEWLSRLEPVTQLRPDWAARWHCEASFYHLSRSEQAQVRAAVDRWPSGRAHPFWDVRRAAVMAEIGDLRDALRAAQEALQRIRSSEHAMPEDIGLLSAEAWAMFLTSCLEQAVSGQRQNLQERWNALSVYRCDPWDEFKALQVELRAAPPHESYRSFVKHTDPFSGSIRRTHRLGRVLTHGKYRPAFSLLRLYEDGAVPYSCGDVVVFNDALERATQWLAPVAFPWATAVVRRLGIPESVQQWYSKVLVAALTDADLESWYSCARAALDQAVNYLISHPTSSSRYSVQQIIAQSEIMARLAIRLSPPQAVELLSRVIELYESPVVRSRHLLHGALGTLLKASFEAAAAEDIARRLPDLLALPIAGAERFSVNAPDRWPEPFDFIDLPAISTATGPDPAAVNDQEISRLIRLAADPSVHTRSRAVIRLAKLFWSQRLSQAQSAAFAEALWARSDGTGLPAGFGFRAHALLALPEPQPGMAAARLRQHLLAADFPRLAVRSQTNGGQVIGRNYYGDAHRRLAERWIGASLPRDEDPEPERTYLEWARDELVALTWKVAAWWAEERDLLAGSRDYPEDDETVNAFGSLVRILSHVILPGLDPADSEASEPALRLLRELDAGGIVTLPALPETLRFCSAESSEVARKIRHGLASASEQLVVAATEGAFAWAVGAGRGRLPAIPELLLDELVTRAVARREPGLNTSLDALAAVVSRSPTFLTPYQIRDLCTALDVIRAETELPRNVPRLRLGEVTRAEGVWKQPFRRVYAARLAFRLDQLREREADRFGSRERDVLDQWRNQVRTDVLPDARAAWADA